MKLTVRVKLRKAFGIVIVVLLNLLMSLEAMAAVVDIMIVYESGANSWVQSNGGMSAFSLDAVSRMNQALENSGLSHRFRLVHSMSVSYTTQSVKAGFGDLIKDSGPFASVHKAREDYGADLVAMMIDTGKDDDLVGQASLLITWSGNKNSAFSVNAIRAVGLGHTLTHEVGHNLGGHHAKDQASQPGPNAYLDNQYSAGWYFTGTDGEDYHTIMAYNRKGNKFYLPAPLFSTPLVNYKGKAAGKANDADNVRLLNQTMPTVADYFASSGGPEKTLTGLTINGPTAVNEGSSATYSATASWSDGSTSSVTPSWSENSSYTTINSSGVLQASSVSSDQSVTVSASYTAGGVTRNDTHGVTVKNVPATLTGVTISGPTTVNEGASATYSATASWSDGSTSSVTPSWSENSSYTTINSSGVLQASSVSSDQSVAVSASYTAGGVTRSDTHGVTIRNVTASLESIRIEGPARVYEQSTTPYRVIASWSDGSTGTVTAQWTESSPYASVDSSGRLKTTAVSRIREIRLGATYTSGSVEKSAVKAIEVHPLDEVGDALGNELTWITGGDQGWFAQSKTTYQPPTAMQSGDIGANQQSYLETTVYGSGTLSFYWAVSSEKNGDYLRLYVNDKELGAIPGISGTPPWRQVVVELPPGKHTLKWVYGKNTSVDAGLDAAWLDQVVWLPEEKGKFPWELFLNSVFR